MHPFEKMFRAHKKLFLNEHFYLKVISEWQSTKRLLDYALGSESTRPSLFNVYNVFNAAVRNAKSDAMRFDDPQKIDRILSTVQGAYCFLMYQYDKRIYDVNAKLFQGLCEVVFPDDAPIECLIPTEDHALVLILPDSYEYNWIVACVDHGVEGDTMTPSKILNIKAIGLTEGKVYCDTIFTGVIKAGQTVKTSLEMRDRATEIRRKAGMYSENGPDNLGSSMLHGILALLAYIKADRDVVAQVHPGKKKAKGWTLRALSKSIAFEPEQFRVGDGYAKVIENYEDGIEESGEGVSGRAVRPHIRRPHAHLYHTKTGPIIHFLPPIPVKGADLKDYDPEKPMKIKVQ